MLAIKRFNEPFGGDVLTRLGCCEPGAFTRLGAAVRHATAVVERQAGTTRRLLLVLSDGFAYDDGYEGAPAEADASRAMEEARGRGIGCVCLNLGQPDDAAALRRVFGSASYAGSSSFEEVVPNLALLLRSALRAAQARPRRHRSPRRIAA
jgi:nitric oxide reductase activation protein